MLNKFLAMRALRNANNNAGGINVTGAEVGQTIVVKAVDENGKPTEWKPANLEKKTKVITVADITAETDIVLTTDDTDDLSFGDAVVGHTHFFYKTPDGTQLKARRVWGYIYSTAQRNVSSSVYVEAYYKDGDPNAYNFGNRFASLNQSGTIPENGYFAFMVSADLGVKGSFYGTSLSAEAYKAYGVSYNGVDANPPHISGFTIRGWLTLPAGSKFVLKAEVEDD